MHISLYFSLYRLLLLESLSSASRRRLCLVLLVLLLLPGRLPLYNSPPPPHETSGGSTSIAEEFGMIEVPYPTTNYEDTRKEDKCKFTHLRIGT
jgi:hypothetical protein